MKTLPAEQSQLEKCGIEEKYAVLTLTQTNVLLFICWRNLNFTYEAHARKIGLHEVHSKSKCIFMNINTYYIGISANCVNKWNEKVRKCQSTIWVNIYFLLRIIEKYFIICIMKGVANAGFQNSKSKFVLLKVSKSRKQILKSWILPKNERNTLRIVSFVFL